MSLSGIFGKLGEFAFSYRRMFFIGFVFLILVSMYGATQIAMNSDLDTYVKKDSQMYQDLDRFNRMFSEQSVVIMIEGSLVKDPEVLKSSARVEDIVKDASGVKSVIGPSTMIRATNLQMTGRDEIPSTAEEVQSLIDLNPAPYQYLIIDETHSLMLVTYGDLTETQQADLLTVVRDAVEFASFPPGYNIIVTGEAALSADMNTEMSMSMGILLMLAVLLMVVALGFVFKGVRWRFYPLLVVIFGLIYTFGFMGFAKINMTMVSMASFPILIGLGIDYAIQFHNRMEEEYRKGRGGKEAIIATFKYMAPAVMIAMMVTCVSFTSLLTSAIPMIQDFGKLLIAGCLSCYTASLFFGVLSLYYMNKFAEKLEAREKETGKKHPLSRLFMTASKFGQPRSKSKSKSSGSKSLDSGLSDSKSSVSDNIITRTMNRIITFTSTHRNIIFIVAFITGTLGFYADSTIPAETDFKTYIPQDMPALINFYHMASVMGGSDAVNIMITTSDIASPYVLKWMDEFGTYEFQNQMYVLGASSLASVVKEANGGVIPDTREEIQAIYDQLPESVMNQYSYGNSLLLLNLNIGSATSDLPMDGVKTLVELIKEDIIWHQLPPGTTATITGGTVPFTELLTSLLSGRVQQTILGICFVFLMLMLIYRNIFKVIGPVITIILVIGWSGLVMYAFNIPYTPMTSVMGCMILGAGSEYSILLMERFYEEKGHGLAAVDAIRTAVTSTGTALLVSGTTTIFGFLALAASAFGIVSSFGVVTVINMIMTLTASFCIFPPLMLTFDSIQEKGLKGLLGGLTKRIVSPFKSKKSGEMI